MEGYFWLLISILPSILIFYLIGGLVLSFLRVVPSTIFLSFLIAWALSGLLALLLADQPTAQAAIDVSVNAALVTSIVVQFIVAVVGKRKPKPASSQVGAKTILAKIQAEQDQVVDDARTELTAVKSKKYRKTEFTPMTLKPDGFVRTKVEAGLIKEKPKTENKPISTDPSKTRQEGAFSDLRYFEIAAEEVEKKTMHKGIWAMAMADVGSTIEEEIIPKYLELRVQQLKEDKG